jgi:hypothetical protein
MTLWPGNLALVKVACLDLPRCPNCSRALFMTCDMVFTAHQRHLIFMAERGNVHDKAFDQIFD